MDQDFEIDPGVRLWTVLAGVAQVLETDPTRAGDNANDLLKDIPGQQQALILLVSARRASGDLAAARDSLKSMAEQQPNLAAVRYELALLQTDLGEHSDALQSLQRVVELEPKHPTAWRTLGDVLAATGATEEAAAAYRRHFASFIMDLKLLEDMAALDLDKIETAHSIVREFLLIHPTDVSAIRLLGQMYMRARRFESAEKVLSRGLDLAPEFTEARLDYISSLREQMKWNEECGQIDMLLREEPDHIGFRYLKALSLARSGRTEDAIEHCDEVLRDNPELSRFWLAKAYALRTAGRSDECIAALRKCVALEPGAGEAWWAMADLKTFQFSGGDLAIVESQLERADVADEDRCYLHFAAGKALEDNHAYAESFNQYSLGNAERRRRHPYNGDALSESLRLNRSTYMREYYRDHAEQGSLSTEPIFILGMPRSGSTLVEQILSSHSAVEGAGELGALNTVAQRAEAVRGPAGAPLPATALKSLGEEYLARTKTERKLDKPHFTDKMPTNFYHLGLICAMLPKAKIIDVRRHPLACCFSNFKQIFPAGSGPSYDLKDMGRYYRDYVGLMAHFDDVLPGRVHRIFYEDLISNADVEIGRLLDYCGLPFEEACLRFYGTDRNIFTASSEQVRRPLYSDSVEQWRHYEKWLAPLKNALGSVLDLYPAVPKKL